VINMTSSLAGCHTYSGTLTTNTTLNPLNEIGDKVNKGSIKNDGAGNINVAFKCKGSDKLSNNHLVKNGEVFILDGLDITQIVLTYIASAAYRIFVSR
jgi:hypothetical protein